MWIRSRRRRATLSDNISGVIQGEGVVRKELLVLVISGACKSSSVRSVEKKESRRSGREEGGLVIKGVH